MYCPQCKNEYQRDIKTCPACKKDLVDVLEESFDRVEAMKPVKVASAKNAIEADLILNLLKNNEIPCFKKDNGMGSYMNLCLGFSVFGEEIFVDERDYRKASELISELFMDHGDDADGTENVFSTEGNVDAKNTDNSERNDSVEKNFSTEKNDITEDNIKIEDIKDDSFKDYAFYRNPHTIVRIYLIAMVIIFILFYAIVRMNH